MEYLISKLGLVTLIWLVIMIVWCLTDGRTFVHSVKEDPFGEYEHPNRISTLGILGTFIGIAVGLYNFDPSPEKMHDSVEALLGD